MIHKQIDEIVNGITAQGRFVYMCTNGLLMNRAFGRIPPSSNSPSWCTWTACARCTTGGRPRWGVRQGDDLHARGHLRSATGCGTNTTIYRGTPAEEHVEFFAFLKEMGVEGCITSPGFDYESVTHDREQFLARKEAQAVLTGARPVRSHGHPLLQQPLFHEFLQGKRDCTAWAMPTYTVQWRSPCYLLADTHVGSLRELYEETDWDAYGTDRDPRCANCLMHCGYEASTILDAFKSPRDLVTLARS